MGKELESESCSHPTPSPCADDDTEVEIEIQHSHVVKSAPAAVGKELESKVAAILNPARALMTTSKLRWWFRICLFIRSRLWGRCLSPTRALMPTSKLLVEALETCCNALQLIFLSQFAQC